MNGRLTENVFKRISI